ncbi:MULTISPECIES: hypothetical protein [Bradyrhizobium]|uniref:Uncharacterized protein n=1 Tax=Bradyrhizobium yuanmingense TaxID=108015 RepID=A0A1C3W756_9BRAD|nr:MULTISPECIES: hypothetical protein [Bradyrhizobium]MCA1384667.1 hypothetical protein [Bradyrhizobium sp. BRP05]MCA1421397.1 hypothetical protein [Bradyrhizobium sp. BRP23]TWI27431.1 hypothetical protein IQ15_02966 [Bradyrhizobium yuanmingense]SCB35691.1 hypothetical protein GA0061099_1005358 [Bradyrhizobium yuanmingense]
MNVSFSWESLIVPVGIYLAFRAIPIILELLSSRSPSKKETVAATPTAVTEESTKPE